MYMDIGGYFRDKKKDTSKVKEIKKEEYKVTKTLKGKEIKKEEE